MTAEYEDCTRITYVGDEGIALIQFLVGALLVGAFFLTVSICVLLERTDIVLSKLNPPLLEEKEKEDQGYVPISIF